MSLKRALEEEKELESLMFQSEESQTQETEDVSTEDFRNADTFDLTQQEPESAESTKSDDTKKRSSWKERFSSYKASTDKTISTLRKENSSLFLKLNEYEKRIDDLSAKIADMASRGRDPFSEVITQEDIDTIGPEAVDIVKKATKRATESAIDPLRKELEEIKAREAIEKQRKIEEARQNAYSNFLSDLGRMVPDYKDLDVNPKFATYLNSLDPYTGELRMDAFRRAENYLDAERVADFFLEFREQQPKSKKELLEERITPEGSNGTQAPLTNKKQDTFTAKEVEKFYNDLTKGVYKGKRKEADELEARITRAYIEGKIV